MDSATALAWSKQNHEVSGAVFFWYGSKHNEREWDAAQKIAAHYGVGISRIDLRFINEHFSSDLLQSGGEIPEGHYADPIMRKTVVPFRNGIMLSIAAGLAESRDLDAVVIGNHAGDHAIYPDCREQFITPMRSAIQMGTYKGITLLSPFLEKDKTQIASYGAGLSVPYELSYSCYKGGEIHCGKCGTCFERKEAFRFSGVTDPTQYLG